MDRERVINANEIDEKEECKHEITFNIGAENGNRLAICIDCGRIRAQISGAEVEGRIEKIEPLVQAVGELIRPIIKRSV